MGFRGPRVQIPPSRLLKIRPSAELQHWAVSLLKQGCRLGCRFLSGNSIVTFPTKPQLVADFFHALVALLRGDCARANSRRLTCGRSWPTRAFGARPQDPPQLTVAGRLCSRTIRKFDPPD